MKYRPATKDDVKHGAILYTRSKIHPGHYNTLVLRYKDLPEDIKRRLQNEVRAYFKQGNLFVEDMQEGLEAAKKSVSDTKQLQI